MEREAAGGEFPSPIVSVEQVDDEETEVVSKREAGGGGGAQTLEIIDPQASLASLIVDTLAATSRPFLGPPNRCGSPLHFSLLGGMGREMWAASAPAHEDYCHIPSSKC